LSRNVLFQEPRLQRTHERKITFILLRRDSNLLSQFLATSLHSTSAETFTVFSELRTSMMVRLSIDLLNVFIFRKEESTEKAKLKGNLLQEEH
jgi:hypothetical protein